MKDWMVQRLARPLLFVTLCWIAPAAVAVQPAERSCEDIDTHQTDGRRSYKRNLFQLYATGCLGGARDSWPAAAALAQTLPPLSEPVDQRLVQANTLEALNSLLLAMEQRLERRAQGPTDPLAALKAPLENAIALVAADKDDGAAAAGFWQFNPSTGDFDGRIPAQLYGPLDQACAQPESDPCQQAYDSAKDTLRFAHAIERALTYHLRPTLLAHRNNLRLLERQWDAYFNHARSQLPWELALNGYLFNRHREERGQLLPPPNYQWILLHPGVAVEYVDEAPEGQQFDEAVLLEAVGYNRWRWGAAGAMKRPMGASLVLSYSDRAEVADLGYGLMVHYRHTLSLGAVSRDGDAGYFLSVDLARVAVSAGTKAKAAFMYGMRH